MFTVSFIYVVYNELIFESIDIILGSLFNLLLWESLVEQLYWSELIFQKHYNLVPLRVMFVFFFIYKGLLIVLLAMQYCVQKSYWFHRKNLEGDTYDHDRPNYLEL